MLFTQATHARYATHARMYAILCTQSTACACFVRAWCECNSWVAYVRRFEVGVSDLQTCVVGAACVYFILIFNFIPASNPHIRMHDARHADTHARDT